MTGGSDCSKQSLLERGAPYREETGMAKEHLTEAKWKSLVSKHKLDDKTVQKALAAFGKLEAGEEYEKQIEALGEISTVATKLKPKVKDNKDAAKFLDEMLKEAKSRTADIEKLKKSSDKQEEEDDDGGDIKKLLARIRSAGEKRVLQFMVCKKGAMRAIAFAKKIGQKHRTELKKKVGDGAKFVKGDCAFEDGKFTFIMTQTVSGMAKTIKKALAAETGKTDYKVRVRDDASTLVLEDEEDREDADFTTLPDLPEEDGEEPEETPQTIPEVDFGQLQKTLKSQMQEALPLVKLDANLGPEFKTLSAQADAAIRQKKEAEANELLDRLQKLIDDAKSGTGQAGELEKALVVWQGAREKAVNQLKALAKAIAAAKDPDSAPAIILVNAIIKNLTARPDTAQKVQELERYIQTDDIIGDAELPNGFGVTVRLKQPLLAALVPLKPLVS